MEADVREVGHEIASAATFGRLFAYPVVDTETHVFVRCWPIETNPQMSPVDPFTRSEHSGAVLVAEMERVGVDLAILIGYDGYDFEAFMQRHGSAPADFMGGRGYTRAWAERFPERLRFVTTLHDPRRHPRAYELLEDELRRGAVGVKIFPPYLEMHADAAEIRAAVDLARERRAGVVFGFEDTVPPQTPSLDEMFLGIARLAGDYPDVPIQLNHGGNADPFGDDGALLFEVVNSHDNVLVSTSVLGGEAMEWPDGWRYPFPEYLRRLESYAEHVHAERLAWASDWPWFEGVVKYPQLLQAILDHGSFFTDEGKRLYLGGNALRHWRQEAPTLEPVPEAGS